MNGVLIKLREERGATAVIFGIALFALLGAALISVDAGGLWSARRDLIADTDASSIAAARYINENGVDACLEAVSLGMSSGAGQEAQFLLTQNDASATMTSFDVRPYNGDCTTRAGQVRVQANMNSDPIFAPIFGINELTVTSASTVQFGAVLGMPGLAPIGMCSQNPHFIEWILENGPFPGIDVGDDDDGLVIPPGEHPSYAGAGTVHRIYFEKTQDPSCGDSQGNWGWLDFDGKGGGQREVLDRLLGGFDGVVWLDDPSTGPDEWDCNPSRNGGNPCPGEPGGRGGSMESTLKQIQCKAGEVWQDCPVKWIIVYDDVSSNGSNATYEHVAFLGVALRGWSKNIGGSPKPDDYFDFEFVNAQGEGYIGPSPTGYIPSVLGHQMCGTEFGGQEDNKCNV